MKSRISMQLGLAVAIALIFGVSRASADMETLNVGNSGLAGYTGPFATATVNLIDSTHATITFDSLTNGNDVYLMGSTGAVGFNVNATSWSVSAITGSNTYTPSDITNFTPGAFSNGGVANEDGFGQFNQTIDSFDSYSHSSSEIVVSITNTGGTWATAGAVLTGNGSGYLVAAHIIVAVESGSTVSNTRDTGFATDGSQVATPAPSSFVLAGIGALCLVGFLVSPLRRKAIGAA